MPRNSNDQKPVFAGDTLSSPTYDANVDHKPTPLPFVLVTGLQATMHRVVSQTMANVRRDRPVHLLGIGGVSDIFHGVSSADTYSLTPRRFLQ